MTALTADAQDYFYFHLTITGSFELWLANIPSGQDYNLVVRQAYEVLVGYSAEVGPSPGHILTDGLEPSIYYIQVFHYSGSGSYQPYHLRAEW